MALSQASAGVGGRSESLLIAACSFNLFFLELHFYALKHVDVFNHIHQTFIFHSEFRANDSEHWGH